MEYGFIKDNLEIMKSMNLNVDLIFVPEIHPDGLVLNYSTTYEFRSEQEDIIMNSNSNCISLPSRIRTYLKKEYGTVDVNDTNYVRHFKEWPLEMSEVVKKLPEQEKEEAAEQIEEAVLMVLDFLKENGMSINAFLYGNLDNEKGIEFEEYRAKVGGVL